MGRTHGGDVWALPDPVLDFSVNLNPLGPPPAALEAARYAIDDIHQYPDPACQALRRVIAQADGVEAGQILCGAGASDLIFRLSVALRPRRALVQAPTFSEYEQALQANFCKVEYHVTDFSHKFDITPSILEQIKPGLDLVILCTPNNPTGRLIPLELLREILARCRAAGAVLTVDECFLPLSDGAGESLVPELPGGSLVLLRALTKTYAIPGLRLGYALCGDHDLLERMEGSGPAWPVSIPAQAAGAAALTREPDWPARGMAVIRRGRWQLADGLKRFGYQVVDSHASYLLFRAPGDQTLDRRLLERGILIRPCADYHGLGRDWYRTAVRTEAENLRLLQALEHDREGEALWPKRS